LTRSRAATGLQHFREVSGQAGLRCRIQQAHLGESEDGRQITAVPQTSAHVKGVINLREQVIPVIDLRLRFEMDTIAYNDRTCIIVVDMRGADSTTRMGVIVGMANMDESVKILLDIDRVFDPEDIAVLEKAA
jgi:purine-binding chemotaxis protein CheW